MKFRCSIIAAVALLWIPAVALAQTGSGPQWQISAVVLSADHIGKLDYNVKTFGTQGECVDAIDHDEQFRAVWAQVQATAAARHDHLIGPACEPVEAAPEMTPKDNNKI